MRCSLGNVLYLVGVRHDGSNPDFSENGENLPVKRFSASLFFDVWNRVCRIIREIDQSFFFKPWRRGGLIRYSLSYCNYVLLGGLKPDRCCIKNNPSYFLFVIYVLSGEYILHIVSSRQQTVSSAMRFALRKMRQGRSCELSHKLPPHPHPY